jgi:hypothetical protein
VSVVHNKPRVVRTTGTSKRIKRRYITVHTKHTVRRNDRSDLSIFRQRRPSSGSVSMRVTLEPGARQQSPVDQRRVTQPIEQHQFSAPAKSGEHSEIRHVSCGKQQRACPPGEGCELFFQTSMFGTMPSNQVRGPTSNTTPLRGPSHRRSDSGMPREAQIVIAAEIDERPPVNNGRYAASRLKVNRSPFTPQMLAIKLRERRLKLRRAALH